MNVLECQALTKRYGSARGLEGVTLAIEPGRIVGLLGPNGSGKTTLIKLATGLLTPSSGTVSVCGHEPGPASHALTAFLSDRSFLPDWMSVRQALDFYEDFFVDFRRCAAEEMLENLSISQELRLKAMSKGTREKVQLILTMSRNARLYLLDEPIGGVDPATRDYILHTIVSSYNPEAAVVISTHLIADVEQVLDEVIFLKDGQVTERGRAVSGGVQMLKKLLKHELIATSRIMLPLYLLVLLAVFANITTRIADHAQLWVISTLSGVSIFTFFLALIAVCLMALVIMIGRFHSNLMGAQGYLMMTLPASIHQLVLAKVITSVLWFCGTTVVCALGLVALFFDSHTLADMGNFFELLTLLLSDGYEGGGLILSGGQLAALGLETCGVTVLAMICFTLFIYASIATGHSFSRRKVLMSFVTFFGMNFLLEVVGTGLSVYLIQYDTVFAPFFRVETLFQGMQMLFGMAAAILLLLSAGFYALTHYMMKHRLNLQ